MSRKTDRIGGLIALSIMVLMGARVCSAGNPQFGMMGLAAGQTLRLNVVAYPPDPCNAQIGFLNSNGATPQPDPSKTVTLNPGQAAFIDLTAASLGIQFGQRREFQPVVTLISISDSVSQCAASVELFDTSTGFSLVVLPQPDPSRLNVNPRFGMVGIGLGQVLRLNVVAFPPDPCIATIGFLNSNGATPQPLPGKTVTLNPGQAAFVDLTAASLGIQFGQRAEFQPVVMLAQTANGTACQASAEVFDTFTGRTSALLIPQPDPN